jgi:hypothetical protein
MDKDESEVDQSKCQHYNLDPLFEPGGCIETVKLPLHHRLRLVLRRSFSPSARRNLKKYIDSLANLSSRLAKKSNLPAAKITDMTPIKFNSGDRVLVKTKEQIQSTLNHWNELKGCSFLPEMWQYCGTEQRVLKSVRRFVDERDCRVKKVKGIYLLEGTICQGFELYGGCDRACFYFWREEWLEKVE